ncbi:MAG: helicase-related protein, partial [Candidatus Thorarchaeota archaeon]
MKEFPEIVDNRTPTGRPAENPLEDPPVITMASTLNSVCNTDNHSQVKIAVGYFSPNGWRLLRDSFEILLKKGAAFDILLGTKYEVERTDEFQKWFQTQLEGLRLEIRIQRHIHRLIEFLKSERVRMAVIPSRFVHAKLYWFPSAAYVGSSNLTLGGLKNNIELNLLTTEKEALSQLSSWFDERFKEADQNYKTILINTLQDCKLGTREWTPFEVFLKIVYEHYKRRLEYELGQFSIPLADFQKEAVIRGVDAVKEFGGVMLADAVGLGKSFEGIEVVESLRREDPSLRRLLIICPAQLRGNWERYDEAYSLGARVHTMEGLSRGPPRGKYDIILIDESHNLRHPRTERWQNLRAYLSNLPAAKIILLTATPVNTSMMDLYNQVLIITKYMDAYPPLSRVGIHDLKEFFNRAKMGDDVSRLRDALIVTRNRTEIRYRQAITGEDLFLPDGRRLVFPERLLHTATYSIVSEDPDKFYSQLGELVDSLTFPQYSLRLFEEGLSEDEKSKVQTAVDMMKILMLKRLESSLPAAYQSLKKQKQLLNLVLPALNRGYMMNAEIADKLCNLALEMEKDDLQDSDPMTPNLYEQVISAASLDSALEAVVTGKEELSIFRHVRQTRAIYDIDAIRESIEADIKTLDKVLQLLYTASTQEDQKLAELQRLVEENALDGEQKVAKVLIFSYYRDTLLYLLDSLKPLLEKRGLRVGAVHGAVPPGERARLVRAFAPLANTMEDEMIAGLLDEEPVPVEEIDILFSTDVLSEGQNLQDASVVINYDLHWNPVRLIQRIGRIDRLGTLHDLVHSYNFFPEEGLEDLIRIIERLEERLADIDLITPSDAPILRPEEAPFLELQRQRSQDLTRLRKEDVAVLDSFEERVGLVGLTESRKALIEFLERHQKEYFDRIPLGIHSGMRTAKIPGLMVAVRVLREDAQPLTLWGFKPDDGALDAYPHLIRLVPGHGVMTHMSFIERQILCSHDTPRHLPEDTTVKGELFEEVVRIGRVLIKSLSTGIEIRQQFANVKYPRGNKK